MFDIFIFVGCIPTARQIVAKKAAGGGTIDDVHAVLARVADDLAFLNVAPS